MRVLAALFCALFACFAADGVDLNVDVGPATSNGPAGGDHRSKSAVHLSIGGGPAIDFARDSVIGGVRWKPVRYQFIARSGATRFALTNG
jgi:hypothetical protein